MTQTCFTAAAGKLKQLRSEFDLSYATATAFDIITQCIAARFPVDQCFHFAQCIERAVVKIAAEYKRPNQGVERGTAGLVTTQGARFDQRITLPVATMDGVIVFDGGQIAGQRPAVAKRPQAHVDPEYKTIGGFFV